MDTGTDPALASAGRRSNLPSMREGTVADLAAWVARRDEAAFRRLVERHHGLVSAVCRRQLDDEAIAADAAQATFIILARRAASVSDPRALESWLYGVALRVCRNARRAIASRARHERNAAMQPRDGQDAGMAGSAEWAALRPHLDDAIAKLNARDRAVVVGHFLCGLSQAAVAERLGISENAARKRIAVALGKLREWFARRGVSLGTGVLVAGLLGEARAAEPGLAAAYAQAALHPTGTGGAAMLASSAMGVATAKLVGAAAALVAMCLAGVVAHQVATRSPPAASPVAQSRSSPVATVEQVHPSSPWARWSRGIPADPGFFPIGVWLQSATNANAYRQAGINLYVRLPEGPSESDLKVLSAAGMRTICQQNEVGLRHLGDQTIVGWMNDDNPDNAVSDGRGGYARPVASALVVEHYRALAARDQSRPIYLLFGQGAAWDGYGGRGVRAGHPEDYREYVTGGDILDFHFYPMNHADPAVSGALWYLPRGVERLRSWSGDAKPVWCGIECTRISTDSAAKPTPEQVRSQVWMALIRGARGFVYFCHVLSPAPGDEAALLHDPVMLPAVTALNHQVAALAPVLNSPTVVDRGTVAVGGKSVPIALMAKRHQGATYLFAAAIGDHATTATFTVPSGDRVEVLGEGRTLVVSGGSFSDDFAAYGVHLYRIRDPNDPR